MKFSIFLFLCAALPLSAFAKFDAGTPENERVIVVANADDPESLDVAVHYMQTRGVPEANLVALPFPRKETISWNEFSANVFSPLRREFAARGLIAGSVPEGVPADDFGRAPLLVSESAVREWCTAPESEKVSFVVLCRGVPLRIENDASRLSKSEGEGAASSGPLDVNCASVDSEIALLGVPGTAANGAVVNPFFKENREKSGALKQLFLRVARLDGVSAADAKALADNAVAAEKTGLLGRALIDIGGPHKEGNLWLEECAKTARALGFETGVERSRALADADSRYDALALYFGWYSEKTGGFFRDPNFRFVPGAVAIHIHSFSATTLRSRATWTSGLVARGATATVGNVFEPYLGMTHRPQLFLEALAAGMSAGEAAAYSIPVFSWQGVFVGDPLYRPFTKTPEAQMAAAMSGLPTRLSQYAFLRAANLAEARGDAFAAKQILKNGEMFAPGLALNFRLAEKDFAEKGACSRAIPVRVPELENPGLLLATARLLAKASRADDALKLYADLLDRRLAPDCVRGKILQEACDLARSRGASARLAVWYPELEKKRKK